MRLSNDKKTLIPYYNKLAFFPVFKCIATGEFAKVYDKMQNNKNPDGSANPVHVLFINSAVKVGNQGVKKYSSDDSFTFNTRKEPFNRLRKQFNTDPVHKEEQAAGTQMLKVALSSLITNHMYTTETGRTETTATEETVISTWLMYLRIENPIIVRSIYRRAARHVNDRIIATIITDSGMAPIRKTAYEMGRFNNCKPPTTIW